MPFTGGFVVSFQGRNPKATDAGLEAVAQVLINGLKDEKPLGLAGGYTSGDFTTGNLLNSIQATEPFDHEGERTIGVYTDVPYAEYWEEGHNNIFTRKFEKQERWRTTADRVSDEAFAAFRRVYERFMNT